MAPGVAEHDRITRLQWLMTDENDPRIIRRARASDEHGHVAHFVDGVLDVLGRCTEEDGVGDPRRAVHVERQRKRSPRRLRRHSLHPFGGQSEPTPAAPEPRAVDREFQEAAADEGPWIVVRPATKGRDAHVRKLIECVGDLLRRRVEGNRSGRDRAAFAGQGDREGSVRRIVPELNRIDGDTAYVHRRSRAGKAACACRRDGNGIVEPQRQQAHVRIHAIDRVAAASGILHRLYQRKVHRGRLDAGDSRRATT